MNYWPVVGFGIFISIWFIIAYTGVISPLFIVTPDVAFLKLIELFANGSIVPDLLYTLYRTFTGFAISIVVGIPIGLVVGHSIRAYKILEPLIDFSRSIPIVALFPLFILIFTLGEPSKIAIVVFGSGLLIAFNTMYGVRNSNKTRALLARTFGASQFDILRKIEFHESLPYIFNGLRLAISFSLVLVIFTEMFLEFTDYGLGLRIYDSYQVREISVMYAVIILSGIIGYLLNLGMKRVEKRIVHWTGK